MKLGQAYEAFVVAHKNPREPKGTPTELNLKCLATLFRGGADEVPNRLDAVDVPHLRRCLAAGLLEVTPSKALRITPAGRAAIAGVEPFKGPPGKNPSPAAKAAYAQELLRRPRPPRKPKGRSSARGQVRVPDENPAASAAQQRLFGMALAIKRGKLSLRKVRRDRAELRALATLPEATLRRYAATPHAELPERVPGAIDRLERAARRLGPLKRTTPGPNPTDPKRRAVAKLLRLARGHGKEYARELRERARKLIYPLPRSRPLFMNASDAFGVPAGAHLVPVRGTAHPKPGRRLDRPAAIYNFMADAYRSPVERFYAIVLDRQHRVLGVVIVSQGSVSETQVHPREAFAPAIEARASSVVFVHNHPSGSARASDADVGVTKRLIEAGQIVGIEVLDHVVIGDQSFVSLRAEHPDLWTEAMR